MQLCAAIKLLCWLTILCCQTRPNAKPGIGVGHSLVSMDNDGTNLKLGLVNKKVIRVTISPEQHSTRRQLTLFVSGNTGMIEKIRKQFNPVQHKLISAHVTLCREDEIIQIDRVIKNIERIKFNSPLKITFDRVSRFEGGKGVWLPSSTGNKQFHELRREILTGLNDSPRLHRPHLTLMHPGNSTCTDKIFDQIKAYELPTNLVFNKISLIEQNDGEPWTTISEYRISPMES